MNRLRRLRALSLSRPMNSLGRVSAMAKPSPVAMPTRPDVVALSRPEAYDRWNPGVRSSSDAGANTITIYDVIGEDFWSGGGVTVNRIDAALRRIGNQAVEIHINSPGGDMFEGIAIYNRLLEHPALVTVKIMGLAASAASIIAMAGEQILIGPASFIMIHDCSVMAIGNRHDMIETAAWLEPFDAAMADVYAARTGMAVKDVAALLDAETWLNGSQAIEKGFADGLLNAADMEIDETANAQAGALNALRKAEIALCKGGATRADARAMLKQIKGTPGAVLDAGNRNDPTPGAGDMSWLGEVAELTNFLRT
jgi:ATP-dependent Clp protease protease subunit